MPAHPGMAQLVARVTLSGIGLARAVVPAAARIRALYACEGTGAQSAIDEMSEGAGDQLV